MLSLFGLNVLLALTWGLLQQNDDPIRFVTGFVVGFVALSILDPEYGSRVLRGAFFVFYVGYQIVKSTLTVAQAVITPGRRVTPGIVAIPLEVSSTAEIILLASVITLTPGTISVETGQDRGGGRVLFVHCLLLDDAEEMRKGIKHDFERRILGFMRSAQGRKAN